MTKSKALIGAVVLAGGLTAVSLTASAAGIPSSFRLGADPHEVSTMQLKQTLEQLGFTGVSNIQKDGRIFELEASWEGETVNLRIDARDRSIKRDEA